jgi:hypothetical protein
MSSQIPRLGLAVILSVMFAGRVMAQPGGADQGAEKTPPPVKPTGPAAKKADDLIRSYATRIEKEIALGEKELDRLRGELHELIDVRDDMAKAIAEVRADLAAKGTYRADPAIVVSQPFSPGIGVPVAPYGPDGPVQAIGPDGQVQAVSSPRDLVYGLGTALPKNPSPQEREQIRRLAPRVELKRMIERLRAQVEDMRAEVDELAYKLLELRAGVPTSSQGMGGNANDMWFGSMRMQGGMM